MSGKGIGRYTFPSAQGDQWKTDLINALYDLNEDLIDIASERELSVVLGPADFHCENATNGWTLNRSIKNGAVLAQNFYANVKLPQDAVVTSLKVKWYKTAGTGAADLRRSPYNDTEQVMASADATLNTGFHDVEDTTISYEDVDNDLYNYSVHLTQTPAAAVNDVQVYGVIVKYTIKNLRY